LVSISEVSVGGFISVSVVVLAIGSVEVAVSEFGSVTSGVVSKFGSMVGFGTEVSVDGLISVSVVVLAVGSAEVAVSEFGSVSEVSTDGVDSNTGAESVSVLVVFVITPKLISKIFPSDTNIFDSGVEPNACQLNVTSPSNGRSIIMSKLLADTFATE